ncbi:MAG: hypothetical protein DRN96_09850 [Thermoproteota archaeon]|nr:MAG: hypothetical protein DRN96_09850 [Candidatus Korarchaeota archaeon]
MLREVKSEKAVTLVFEWLTSDYALLTALTPSEERELRALLDYVSLDPRIPRVDEPEAIGLVLAKSRGLVLLTENRGARRITQYHPEYRSVKVWGALRVLAEAAKAGVIKADTPAAFKKAVSEYSKDTLHLFSEKDLRAVLSEYYGEHALSHTRGALRGVEA